MLITVRVNAAGRPRANSHSLPSMVAAGERPVTVQFVREPIPLHVISLDVTQSAEREPEGEGKELRFAENEDG